ncbi:GGDEF domain-containing protein [Deinococcus navajonensis]|uniref:GGDEF domain-containing protein n=1 Tax=Deinococcus navajonensis TaxID=309884 RepID=A0ABV8XMD0_9DEIO
MRRRRAHGHSQPPPSHDARRGPSAVAILDLDHFKAVNDTYGHDGGDRVLRTGGQCLRSTLEPETLPARSGGEEFVTIFPLTAFSTPAEQLEPLRISFTAGVVGCDDGDLVAALRRADALLEGKCRGRL